MDSTSNAQVERYYFEQFRNDFPLPAGEIIYTDKPDVIIRGPTRLGIEITNLYIRPGADPTSEQVQRRRREQALHLAQSLYQAHGGKRFELSVDFHPGKPILDYKLLARAICELAQRLIAAPTGQVSPSRFADIDMLRFVYLNATEYADAQWRVVQSFTVPSLSVERLREVVVEKSKKLAAYQPCDQYWLLAVIDLMDVAQDQHVDWPAGEILGNSPFERVLLYKPQCRQVLEVPQ
ncbi:hypothetical protein KAK07_25050 [Ideonella sp. 4Y16]|uniref:hypothetical protein n=1 Tax=Ideonella alba TaxID=2824118 RepID=UPI001B365C78|nr:hypothetical protein [Ideonella alba]MBQ0946618.1 hypothetical protein [Ideonella alba]